MFNKKGISHIELIAAILIFIFAIAIIVTYITIGGTQTETTEPLLDILEANLRKDTEINFYTTKIFVDFDTSNLDSCFKIQKHSDLKNEDFIFIKKNGNPVAFDVNDFLFIKNEGLGLYDIYSFKDEVVDSQKLNDNTCKELTKGEQYNYSITFQDKIFSENKLKLLDEKNYDELKIEWGINNYFEVNIKTKDSFEMNLTEMRPPGDVRVYAKEFSTDLLLQQGEIVETKINIKIW